MFRYGFKHLFNNSNKMCFGGVLLGENILNTLYILLTTVAVCLRFLSANNQHKMVICPYVWKSAKYMEIAWPC